MEQPADAALIGRVLDGDVDTYAVLVARYRDRSLRFAMHMLGNREDAEEVLQDAFVRAYRSLAQCEDPAHFGSWFFQILVNRCRTAGGRRRRREQIFVHDEAALLADAEAHPAERAAWREEIAGALARLDAEYREAFLLKYVQELSYQEMAEITGCGISALKMRVKRACDRLRDMLQEVHSV
ncbi:MAG: RNA polymerase sigma factor [Chloroflexota bacterium]|nr:RNA polymerase sigma factor [Chloroflexota bacterium]